MMYRLKEGLKPEDYNQSMQIIRNELEGSIQYEQHRDNVDRAKKRAVKQLMDYEGFRQMVLGADLKTINRDELKDLAALDKGKRFSQKLNFKDDPNHYDVLNGTQTIVGKSDTLFDDDESELASKENVFRIATPNERLAEAREIIEEPEDEQGVPHTFAELKKYCGIILGLNPDEERELVLVRWMQKCLLSKYLPSIFTIASDVDTSPLIGVWNTFDRLTKELMAGKRDMSSIESDLVWFIDFFTEISTLKTFLIQIKPMLKSTERSQLKKILERIEGSLAPDSTRIANLDLLRKAYLK